MHAYAKKVTKCTANKLYTVLESMHWDSVRASAQAACTYCTDLYFSANCWDWTQVSVWQAPHVLLAENFAMLQRHSNFVVGTCHTATLTKASSCSALCDSWLQHWRC